MCSMLLGRCRCQMLSVNRGNKHVDVCMYTHIHVHNTFMSIFIVCVYICTCVYICCSVIQLCPTLCNSVDCRTPVFPVLHHLLEFAQTHVHWVNDAIQPSLSLPSPDAFNLSQHQGLFQWVSSSHQVAKELELQLQHQSFQWIFRVDFL